MPKKLIEKYIPHPDKIKATAVVRFLGDNIQNPNLWHLNRHSVSKAFFVGVFSAFLPPVPVQMLVSASLAVLFHANLPLSMGLVWISNPLIWPFVYGISLKVGFLIMGKPENLDAFDFSAEWLMDNWSLFVAPFMVGCLITGLVAGLLSYLTINLYWRFWILKRWRTRKSRVPVNQIPE